MCVLCSNGEESSWWLVAVLAKHQMIIVLLLLTPSEKKPAFTSTNCISSMCLLFPLLGVLGQKEEANFSFFVPSNGRPALVYCGNY
jgi:hypothetical protein